MVNLRKEAKINLVKGQRICLTKTAEKSGEKINFAFLGANWSSLKDGSSVDLDLSVLVYDKNKKLIDINYYGKLISDDRALKHSADDLDGDDNGQMDDRDNEIIKIDFDKITSKAEYLVCVLNSYRHQNFGIIPGIECRIYTNNSGRENDVDEVLASYKIDNNEDYEGNEAIILAHFYRHNDLWKFAVDSIGSSEKSISEISKGTALKVID